MQKCPASPSGRVLGGGGGLAAARKRYKGPVAFPPAAVCGLRGGPNRIQAGVAAGTIEARRVLVLRGILRDVAGNGLSGARVELKDRDECGFTITRADGAWDMACNGGGQLIVRMTKGQASHRGSARIYNRELLAA